MLTQDIPQPDAAVPKGKTGADIGIVGSGLNCIYLLERMYAQLRQSPDLARTLSITVIEKRAEFGPGCHYTAQPQSNHLNRTAGQVSFAADASHEGELEHILPDAEAYTLLHWLSEVRPDLAEGLSETLTEGSWISRALFGEVCKDIFDRLVGRLKRCGATVSQINAEVVDAIEKRGKTRLTLRGSDQHQIEFDYLVLCNGHGANRVDPQAFCGQMTDACAQDAGLTYVHNVYPLEQLGTQHVPANKAVICRGMGLVGIDVALHLTQGRGGQFAPTGAEATSLMYSPSGEEPSKIHFASGSGVMIFARAMNQKGNDPDKFYHGTYLTRDTIDKLRRHLGISDQTRLGRPLLDYERHVLPVQVLESMHAYYAVLLGPEVMSELQPATQECFVRFLHGAFNHFRSTDEIITALTGDLATACHERLASLGRFISDGTQDAGFRISALECFLRVLYGTSAELWSAAERAKPDVVHRKSLEVLTAKPAFLHDRNPLAHVFSWDDFIHPLHDFAHISMAERDHVVRAFLRKDIADAEQGNLDNPRKAAIDGVWRDLRGVLKYAVEFGGLTDASHSRFVQTYTRMVSRLAQGTSTGIMHRILAIAEAGIIDFSVSQSPEIAADPSGAFRAGYDTEAVTAPTVLNGVLHRFNLNLSDEPIVQALSKHGMVRPYRRFNLHCEISGQTGLVSGGGIDFEQSHMRVIGRDGAVNSKLFVLGTATEGHMFFHLAAMRPNCCDQLAICASKVAQKILGDVALAQAAKPTGFPSAIEKQTPLGL